MIYYHNNINMLVDVWMCNHNFIYCVMCKLKIEILFQNEIITKYNEDFIHWKMCFITLFWLKFFSDVVFCEGYKGAVKRFWGNLCFWTRKLVFKKCNSWSILLLFIKKQDPFSSDPVLWINHGWLWMPFFYIQYYFWLAIRSIASIVASRLPNAENLTNPSPLRPNPAPGVVTMFFSFNK